LSKMGCKDRHNILMHNASAGNIFISLENQNSAGYFK